LELHLSVEEREVYLTYIKERKIIYKISTEKRFSHKKEREFIDINRILTPFLKERKKEIET